MKTRKSTSTILSIILLLIFHGITDRTNACSTFMLKTNSQQIFGHNLNMGKHIPGLIFINKRGLLKKGHTWKEITSNNPENTSNLNWVSKYGSVTFNCFGREFPDGGMNEEGLFIWEMTGISTFEDETKGPTLFMAQWMQYQLDNYKTVEEALDNISRIALDGWNWHFFIADKHGETASIEFVHGIPIVNSKSNMPIPLMGNGRYSEDISFIKEFEGFGGNIPIDLNDEQLPGYIKAAQIMNNYTNSEKIVDYGFDILTNLSSKAKWSIIFDLKNMTGYFRTAKYPNIKSFSIQSFDFSSGTPVQILNIQNAELKGDVSNKFIDFNHDDNLKLTKEVSNMVFSPEEFDISVETLANRLATSYQTTDLTIITDMEGTWLGKAEYPTTGDPAEVDWKLEIVNQDGKLTGRITDSAGLLADTQLRNIAFENGIFIFTVYSYGYVFKIFSTVSGDGINGIFDISNESRKGNFYVQINE